jgi:hypothetical protein
LSAAMTVGTLPELYSSHSRSTYRTRCSTRIRYSSLRGRST